MAASDAATLEALKTARDAVLAAIAAGQLVVEYQIGSIRKRSSDPIASLKLLDELIAKYEFRSQPRFRLAKPQRATN